MEHGHVHIHPNKGHTTIPVGSILIGMSLHAFMEGIPLGLDYEKSAALPSLYVAIAAHKLPEAILTGTLLFASLSRPRALLLLFVFSLISPLTSIIIHLSGNKIMPSAMLMYTLLPIVAGSFIHIATTIFFESGTKQHALNAKKVGAMIAGLALGLLTLLID
jgi:zinc transporter ZupT